VSLLDLLSKGSAVYIGNDELVVWPTIHPRIVYQEAIFIPADNTHINNDNNNNNEIATTITKTNDSQKQQHNQHQQQNQKDQQ
jgi:hypothetical protein